MTRILIALACLTGSALGAEPVRCITVAEDRAMAAVSENYDYIGVVEMPFTEGFVVVYRRHADDFAVFSPVIDGCVLAKIYPLGKFKARTGA